MKGYIMLYVIKWVLLAICSALGMALIPTMATTGFILAFGCFLVLALDIARQFIDWGYMKKIRSKKDNLLNYFIHDHKYLSKNYLKSCNKFFKNNNLDNFEKKITNYYNQIEKKQKEQPWKKIK